MNKKTFLLIAIAVFVVLIATIPFSAQASNGWGFIKISPLSGNWNYPGYYVLEAQQAPLTVEWEIKCSYVPCPREEEFGTHTFTYIGETIHVGWGHQCYAWQFDPIGRTGFIAEAEPWLCVEPSPTPSPTATPIVPGETPTNTPSVPTATPGGPTITPTSPAETPPGPTPTPGGLTPTPGEPTPTPADQTPPPGEPTPTPVDVTPTPTPLETPTPASPPGQEQPALSPTPRLLLPVAGELPPASLFSSPLWPALAALLLVGLAGSRIWTAILQAEKAQVPVNMSSALRSQARQALVLILLSVLILAYMVLSSTGGQVPADLRDTGAFNPPAPALVQEQAPNPALVLNDLASNPGLASTEGATPLEILAGSQLSDLTFIESSSPLSAGGGDRAFSALAGKYQEENPLDTSPVTRLVVPALGVDAVVHYIPFEDLTWDVQDLGLDIAWLGNTSSPGLGGNTVLAGHVTTVYQGNGPFRYLARLQPGDLVHVHTERYIYTYSAREQMVVKPNDSRVVGATEEAQLTLITCTGWNDEDRGYTSRRAVFADLVSVQSLAGEDGDRWR
jgi:LPXTG-site transpeptidase (sortase) family protein